MLELAVPDGADVDDPRLVKRANPASWLTPELLAEQREAVADGVFRRCADHARSLDLLVYHCNQWVEGGAPFSAARGVAGVRG